MDTTSNSSNGRQLMEIANSFHFFIESGILTESIEDEDTRNAVKISLETAIDVTFEAAFHQLTAAAALRELIARGVSVEELERLVGTPAREDFSRLATEQVERIESGTSDIQTAIMFKQSGLI